MHAAIRGQLAAEDAEVAAKVQLLYGGSVKAANAAELFGMPDIDGVSLVGLPERRRIRCNLSRRRKLNKCWKQSSLFFICWQRCRL